MKGEGREGDRERLEERVRGGLERGKKGGLEGRKEKS